MGGAFACENITTYLYRSVSPPLTCDPQKSDTGNRKRLRNKVNRDPFDQTFDCRALHPPIPPTRSQASVGTCKRSRIDGSTNTSVNPLCCSNAVSRVAVGSCRHFQKRNIGVNCLQYCSSENGIEQFARTALDSAWPSTPPQRYPNNSAWYCLHPPTARISHTVQVVGSRADENTWQGCPLPDAPVFAPPLVQEHVLLQTFYIASLINFAGGLHMGCRRERVRAIQAREPLCWLIAADILQVAVPARCYRPATAFRF